MVWHKPAYILENDTHKLLRDFKIQTAHLISARSLDLIIINKKKKKKTCRIVYFAVSADHRMKLEKVKRSTCTLLGKRKKQTMEHEGDNYTNRD